MTPQASHAGNQAEWLYEFDRSGPTFTADGLVRVTDYNPAGRPPEEVVVIERARTYEAHSVFFEAGRNGKAPTPQAFLYTSTDKSDDNHFAQLHKRLWNWGGVPLIYRKIPGQIQLFRCAHDPDFISPHGDPVCRPFKTLDIAVRIAELDAWWNAEQLRNGTLWDDPRTCRLMLSSDGAAHRNLVEAVRELYRRLNDERLLTQALRRKLLILTILIAYLEERGVFRHNFFSGFLPNATRFFHILCNAQALISLLTALEKRFNGNIFSLTKDETDVLRTSEQPLNEFARLVEGYEAPNGQMSFWRLYSFKDLPIELISNIYQLFVSDKTSSVYTPPNLVRLMMDEALPWDRLDRLITHREIILDPACGSGVFLVEAYRRLVLHWRSKNNWAKPTINDLKPLLNNIYGFDVEEAAVELAGFSLCLALCDSLEPEDIRASVNLFPQLTDMTIHHTCFFAAKECLPMSRSIGAIVGNPPFKSKLTTPGALRSYDAYHGTHGHLADRQLAYLFLHDAMQILHSDGVLCMIQPSGFLYNHHAAEFRYHFFSRWMVPEVLDFVSVRGLFRKGQADPKVVVVLALSKTPSLESKTLHAVFRRNGRATAEQGFDVDYYDLHWIQNKYLLNNKDVWRSNLFGGGRFHDFVQRLREFRTLGEYAIEKEWDVGEGYIAGRRGVSKPADHLIGKPFLPTRALSVNGLDTSKITSVPDGDVEVPRTKRRFTPPLLLVKQHENLYHATWHEHYLTYKHKIVGFSAPEEHLQDLIHIERWITENLKALRAYTAGISLQLLSQRATAIGTADIKALPFPEDMSLHVSENEQIVIDDTIDFIREFIRTGSESRISRTTTSTDLAAFVASFVAQINAVYTDCPIRALDAYHWPGSICQPFTFGEGAIDWTGANQLRGRLDHLLREFRGSALSVTRIARIYDGTFLFLLKPDSLRFWLRSVALRDADDVRADMRDQGF